MRAILVASLLLSTAALAVEPIPTGYQGTTWGMSPAQVRKVFPKVVKDKAGDLTAPVKIAGFDARVLFKFVNDKLTAAVVMIRSGRNAAAEENFQSLLDALQTKYGDYEVPSEDDFGTKQSAFWRGEQTVVMLLLDKMNFTPWKIAVVYRSVELLDEVQHLSDTSGL